MRRRRGSDTAATAQEVVNLYGQAKEDARELHLDPEAARAFVAATLEQAGTDPVEAIRARRWLRRGRRGPRWRQP